MTVKAQIRTSHEGQGEQYVYIYTLSLKSDLDAVEWSTAGNGCSTLKKDTSCSFAGGQVVPTSGVFLMIHSSIV